MDFEFINTSGIPYTYLEKEYRAARVAYHDLRHWLYEEVRIGKRKTEEGEDRQRELRRMEGEAKGMKKEAEGLKAKLLRSEVAREKAEAEWKTLVEQRDRWRREAEKMAAEKEKMERDLRQELRAAKLAARRAPTTTSATQTTPPETCSTTTQTTETKPTYASAAWQHR